MLTQDDPPLTVRNDLGCRPACRAAPTYTAAWHVEWPLRDAKRVRVARRQAGGRRLAERGCAATCRGQRVTTMKSVPSPVSGPRPWSDTTSDEPGDHQFANLVDHVLRNFDAGECLLRGHRRRLAIGDWLFHAFALAMASCRRLTGRWPSLRLAFGASPGSDTTFQRNVEPSARYSIAVKTCVPSGCSGFSMVIGASNTGAKFCRTKILPSLRLTKIAIGAAGAPAHDWSAGLASGNGTSRCQPVRVRRCGAGASGVGLAAAGWPALYGLVVWTRRLIRRFGRTPQHGICRLPCAGSRPVRAARRGRTADATSIVPAETTSAAGVPGSLVASSAGFVLMLRLPRRSAPWWSRATGDRRLWAGLSLCTNRCGSAKSVGAQFGARDDHAHAERVKLPEARGEFVRHADAAVRRLMTETLPSCSATPDQVMRCMNGIGAPL